MACPSLRPLRVHPAASLAPLVLAGFLWTAGLEARRPDVHPPPGAGAETALYRSALLMGTRLDLHLPGPLDRQMGLAASEAALREVARIEGLLSSWQPESVVSLANRSPVGSPAPLPPEVSDLLAAVLDWSRRTGGAFDPRIGALVDAWDLRGAGRVPDPHELDEAVAASGRTGMILAPGGLVRRSSGAWLDAGGFGKGAALARARAVLRERGVRNARLDFGGQLLLMGSSGAPGGRWQVSVAHPVRRRETAATLRVPAGSVATSGSSERGIQVGGKRYGHLLDPRTGRPVPAWGSVTVVSDHPLTADVLSTALFVLGPEAGRAFAHSLVDAGVLFLVPTSAGLQAYWNAPMDRWLEDVPPPSGPVPAYPQPAPEAPMSHEESP